MKILIVSGFLGAGKTTFIQTMAGAAGHEFVVYENEYAGAGIDTARLEENAGLNVWESTENCVCCSGKGDFASALLTISSGLNPEYLVVEPTGAARLSAILSNAQQMLYGSMQLLRPVVIVDAVSFWRSRLRMPELYEDQIHSAAVAVLSKTEQLSAEEIERVKEEIRKMNPSAELVDTPFADLNPAWFQTLLSASADGKTVSGKTVNAEVGEEPEQLTLQRVFLDSPTELLVLLNRMTAGACGEILRAKGSLSCGGEDIRFDFVEGQWAVTGEEKTARGECVFIGKNLNRERIREAFGQRLGPAGVVSRGRRSAIPKGKKAYIFRPERATEKNRQ